MQAVFAFVAAAWLVGCANDVDCPSPLIASSAERCECPTGQRALHLPNGKFDRCITDQGGPPEDTARDGDVLQPDGDAGSDARVASRDDAAIRDAPTKDAAVIAVRDGAPVEPPRPASPQPGCVSSAERCDSRDDDCDGRIDEGAGCAAPVAGPCAPKVWYRDCDADGFAALRGGTVSSCESPAPLADCKAWTTTEPMARQVDCDDTDPNYFPNQLEFGVIGKGNGDRNCDNYVERQLLRVHAPKGVYAPPADAALCSDTFPTGCSDCGLCDCFSWEPRLYPNASTVPCAKEPSDAFDSLYWMFTNDQRNVCFPARSPTLDVDPTFKLIVVCK
jgi:hypothetical protein